MQFKLRKSEEALLIEVACQVSSPPSFSPIATYFVFTCNLIPESQEISEKYLHAISVLEGVGSTK
jgi:hypothetical protein